MNPGVTEEAGATARTVVEAMKSSPGILALVIFNVLFMGVVGYLSIQNSQRSERDAARWQEIATNAVKLCAPQSSTP